MSDSTQETKTRKLRLTKAVKSPELALDRGWFRDSSFCEGFFDRCEDEALAITARAFDLASWAVQIAETNGDPHLVNQSYGVLSHAWLARPNRFWAGKTLEGYRDAALDCCPRCRSHYFRRQGDLLGEERRVRESLEALRYCVEEGAGHLDDNAWGRISYVRGATHHFLGNRDLALADAGETLRRLPLDAPRGFFLDTIACIVIYVGGGGTRHDALALELLEGFQERIAAEDWPDVRRRHMWGVGHIHARLGDARRANRNLENAHRGLLKHGLAREALAVTLDLCQFKCRSDWLRDDNKRAAQRAIRQCLALRTDLSEDQRRTLEDLYALIDKNPESAFAEIGAFRRSFIAPVPGQLGERIGPE